MSVVSGQLSLFKTLVKNMIYAKSLCNPIALRVLPYGSAESQGDTLRERLRALSG